MASELLLSFTDKSVGGNSEPSFGDPFAVKEDVTHKSEAALQQTRPAAPPDSLTPRH